MKITKSTLKSVQPSDKDQWIWDSTLPGFGVRVWPTGRAVYVVRYRTGGGTQRKLTIGDARVMDPDAAREEARRAHPRAHRRWMFPNSKGEPVDCSYKYWDEVRAAIGLPNLRVHDLLHTYASYALTQVNIKEVQQMLGHASVVTTERYLHVFDDALQAAQSKAGALMSQLAITGQRPNPPEKKAARRLTVVK